MKSILKIIISIIVIVVAAKLFFKILPVIIILIAGIWFYSRYKMKKIIKQYKEDNDAGTKFSTGEKEETKTKEEEINEEDNFNGTVIDVDFEDIKKD
ncbi:hypothetical protein [uncultured Clostridium sp.]|jgi:Tfp pilus assembly protein PilO|uniref:hypothetical protein n=1 Tax=uncultured Clostridium sp. TaxID=59620 RepID=UPI00262B4DDF|nr:hypothetical protein [uncultured Clostridium sp.]